MAGVKLRLAGALIALLLPFALVAAAAGQDDTAERPKSVKKVYRDYRDDGVIEACDHTKKALQQTLDTLPPEADVDTPDLRPALEAAIEQVEQNDCPEPTPEPTPSATPSPAPPPPASTPVPTTPPDTGNDDSLGAIPPPGGNDGGNNPPPSAEDVTPLDPEVTPVPPAATPAPAAPPAEPSGPEATPAPVYENNDDAVPLSLILLGGLIALVALLALLYALLSRLGWAERPLSRVRRTWREAGFRAGGTWADFADWIRVGR
jgi:hypothetical protein